MARNTRFASPLSHAEYKFARRVEAAGLASISQAVKAIERGETGRIAAWREQLRKLDAANE